MPWGGRREKIEAEHKKEMALEDNRKQSSSSWLYIRTKCFQIVRSWSSISKLSSPVEEQKQGDGNVLADSNASQKKPGGWKAMPFIIGNESLERLASFGLLANFMVYLTRELHMDQVMASNIINIWSGVTNFAPLVGAFVSDAYVGRFRTIAFASFASLLLNQQGLMTVTLTAWMPELHPPPCAIGQQQLGDHCMGPTKAQLGVLLMGLGFLSIGAGGVRPCSIPFGVDQFDPTTDEGRKGINSFFNWYYTTFTVVLLLSLTIVVYIQDSVSWIVGFGMLTACLFCSIILYFVGTKIYVHVKAEGSAFSSIVQVFVAAYKKRRIKLPVNGEVDGIFYDPPLKGVISTKLPFTNQFKFLNKAAKIEEDELNPDGTCSKQWRLCSIQQVEEVKCIIRIIPIWAAGIISLTSMIQQGTFTISQALKMDRHLGPKFQIPAGSMAVISMITIGLWLPFYDRLLVPALRKITGHEGGITLLQRIGIGIVFSILSMVVAGLVERVRRASAILNPQPLGVAPISVMWLAPQLILMGFCEAFNIIGQIEFFNRQFPEHMRSLGNAFFSCSFAGASYLSSVVVTIVHQVTGTRSHPDWLTNDINAGRLDYLYFIFAGMGVLNLIYFMFCSRRYRYKGSVQTEDNSHHVDLELSAIKA
ncbi:Protein NRT1/ PTR FAMILY 2.13 [Morella rubra]|uniref:Protein NRT1/ PTR FAMILY 2.13 n=1 Tax=Morella rubra TaxID=262757 RepID=A0A6A1W636_9ROSI|nr:Protein NRT1/ PTR FAMILY 2.13 [Morella rubra]